MSSLIRQIMLDTPSGYWPFQGDYKDLSGNGMNGSTVAGATTTTLSPFGTVLNISGGGSGQYVSVPDSTTFRFDGTSISVEAWVNPSAFSATEYIVAGKAPSSGGGTHDWLLYYDVTSIAPRFWLGRDGSGSSFITATSSTRLTIGRWYHLVGTYSGAGTHTATIYVDGVVMGTNSTTTATASIGTANVVRWGDYQGDTGNLKMCHCAIYDFELSATRVKAHYDAGREIGMVLG